MTYAAVVFDLFGTLIDTFLMPDYRRHLSEMGDAVGVPPEEFARLWIDTVTERCDGTFKSMEDNIRHICQATGAEPDASAVDRAVAMRHAFALNALVPRTDAVSTIEGIKATGRHVGLVSDCAPDVPIFWPETPFAGLIEQPVFSCDVGTRKPDPLMYNLACERLGVAADDCLYVGDGSSNELAGAQAAGMHPVLIRVPYEDHPDAYRPDANPAPWTGPTISSLTQVLALLDDAP
jgi:putative hydrolase of the HAD superfamily